MSVIANSWNHFNLPAANDLNGSASMLPQPTQVSLWVAGQSLNLLCWQIGWNTIAEVASPDPIGLSL